jgi:hypothetical protein
MVESTPDPLDRIPLMKHKGVEPHRKAESAIRAWARSDGPAAETQRPVDSEGERVLTEAFVDAGIPHPNLVEGAPRSRSD